MTRTEYSVKIRINGRSLNRVVIDQHYKEKHSDSINDQVILDLLRELDSEPYPIEAKRDGFQYFAVNLTAKDGKPYRLVLLLSLTDDYLGVINAFRVQRRQI